MASVHPLDSPWTIWWSRSAGLLSGPLEEMADIAGGAAYTAERTDDIQQILLRALTG